MRCPVRRSRPPPCVQLGSGSNPTPAYSCPRTGPHASSTLVTRRTVRRQPSASFGRSSSRRLRPFPYFVDVTAPVLEPARIPRRDRSLFEPGCEDVVQQRRLLVHPDRLALT